ncbi:Penicillin-binding protein [Bacillus thuringiensis serovar israelensis ATCC 35646]|nr:Penicillin-binding protein [Bacillus thuringiensis serovar israelensis ATCC 35646]
MEVRSMSKFGTPVMTSLQTTVEKMMKDLNVPGAAVAVIKDGEVIISEGFGYRNIETKEAVTPHTRFAIGPQRKALAPFISLLTHTKIIGKSVQLYTNSLI